jgi:hypothetical protein
MLDSLELGGGERLDGTSPLAAEWQQIMSAPEIMRSSRLRVIIFSTQPASIPMAHRPAATIVLHEDRWINHITKRHPEVIGKEHEVEEVVRDASALYESGTPGTFLFVKDSIVDAFGRSLRVVVRGGEVLTAYYSSANGGRKIWP